MHILQQMISCRANNKQTGIYSACSASPIVIEAVLERAAETGRVACIEATANQINQFGGYTGMFPADFVRLVHGIAEKVGFPVDRLILGGDHLGPLVWRYGDAEDAMRKAEDLIACYVKAGFDKIHIDTSMPLGNEKSASDEQILERAIRLALASENAANDSGKAPPVYVIGSEVPVPGGATSDIAGGPSITTPESFTRMIDDFKRGFEGAGLSSAWQRVIAAVVQPGVEFGDDMIHEYERAKAAALTLCLKDYAGLVFEGHSTDYQTSGRLSQMVADGVAILKVGPALTFAQRECVFALSKIEDELCTGEASGYIAALERAMLDNPVFWEKYYKTDGQDEQKAALKRKYSYADRCRYYLSDKSVMAAFDKLRHNLKAVSIPLCMLSQYLPNQYDRVREGKLSLDPDALIKDYIKQACIRLYEDATQAW